MKSNDCSSENKPPGIPLVVIGSPTATGKTRLSLQLAESLGAEIVNADSLQVYRYLDIGTAKPTLTERERIKHHLLDVVDPDEDYNAALYCEQARALIADLALQGKRALVVGGTGLYIRALLQGIIDTPPVDENIRKHYKELRDRHGRAYVFGLLRKRDPQAADRLNPNDSVRVIRALEVLDQSGQSILELQKMHRFADCPYKVCKIGLRVAHDELKKSIHRRTEQMEEAGLLDEVRGLLDRGYSEKLKPLQSLGYKQVLSFIRGRCDWNRARDDINRETWQYAKRQMTWFRADKSIAWYGPDEMEKIEEDVRKFLAQY
jgi:tRNA dimethylallyltransferase